MKKSNNHAYFMQQAIIEARKGIGAGHGGPFGAVIVKNGKIVAKGHNEVIKNNDATCHGEMQAIRAACKKLKSFDLSGCVIYTTGFPCPMCMGACKWAHIKRVYYGCNEKDTTKIDFDDSKFYRWKLRADCIERPKCLEVYKEYSQLKNKKHY